MQLKVNNCGECPFIKADMMSAMCHHPQSDGSLNVLRNAVKLTIHKNCPLKTSHITIKIEENDSNK